MTASPNSDAESEKLPHDAQASAVANELSSALKELQRALIRADIGDDPVLQGSPYSALFALIGDPRFNWMEPLSKLIVTIDEKVAEKEITGMDVVIELRKQAGRLIGEGKEPLPEVFRMHHVMALQKDSEAGLATGRLRKALAKIAEA